MELLTLVAEILGFKRINTVYLAAFIVLVTAILSYGGTEAVVNAIYQDDQYFSKSVWPRCLAFCLPGCLFLIGGIFSKRTHRDSDCSVETGPLCWLVASSLFVFALLFFILSLFRPLR